MSIRAIELFEGSLGFAGNQGLFGTIDLHSGKVLNARQKYKDLSPEFRAVAHTKEDFFMLSIGSPALLYKTGSAGSMEIVYKEDGEGVFYDSMIFWNEKDGIGVGDVVGSCLSIIITRDGGRSWDKIPCTQLPTAIEGEGLFAASNTNIAVVGDKCWIGTNKGRVYFSGDRGLHWTIQQTPFKHTSETAGIFSVAFFDSKKGALIGGDFKNPQHNIGNKAITTDGGLHWELVADGEEPGYRSCIQFIPGSNGNELLAVGFKGIDYSNDFGKTWKKLSDEGLYTIRFLNDTIAYGAGKNRIVQLLFNRK